MNTLQVMCLISIFSQLWLAFLLSLLKPKFPRIPYNQKLLKWMESNLSKLLMHDVYIVPCLRNFLYFQVTTIFSYAFF